MTKWTFIEPYIYASAPSIFLSIMTITLNIFVIKFYWKKELTVVSLLYTFIALLDILTAIGIIHLNVIFLLYDKELISEGTGNVNVIISSFFKEISYICSVFSNLVLAVSRTIMILKPFYQINSRRVQLACVLYSVPWIVLYGLNVPHRYQFSLAVPKVSIGRLINSNFGSVLGVFDWPPGHDTAILTH